jgi:hypothetical protein
VVELKEVATEFASSTSFSVGFDRLMSRVITENPSWRPALFGGTEPMPEWFHSDFARLFRPPISRILKKANRQIRETKAHFDVRDPTGTLLFVNDGFTTLGPEPVRALASDLLVNSYSSIDCLIYLTVNRYVEIMGSDVPRLVWAPVYSDRAPDRLIDFVNSLGSAWYSFLEHKIGPFTTPKISASDGDLLRGAQAIVIPPK